MPQSPQTQDPDPNQKAIKNERVKLIATTINTLGLAFAGTGTIIPIITLFTQGEAPKSPLWPAVGVSCLVFAATLHLLAHWTLGKIRA